MSTEDDRYTQPVGYTTGHEDYGHGEQRPGGFDAFSAPSHPDEETTILPGGTHDYEPYHDDEPVATERTRPGWHGGADLGLLALRVTVGVLFVGHGLQKLFGWLDGPGVDGFAQVLAGFGYSNTTLLTWVTGCTEIVGGSLLVLGLFTPVGAAAVLGVIANVIVVKANTHLFAAGVETEIVLAAGAFAILFAGPGRISLDRNTPWYRNAFAVGAVFLVIAAGATVGVLLGLR